MATFHEKILEWGWPEAKIHVQIQRWAYGPRDPHAGVVSVLEFLPDLSLEQTRVEMVTQLSFLMKSVNPQRIVFQMTHFLPQILLSPH